jgi:outer membrane protein TolC
MGHYGNPRITALTRKNLIDMKAIYIVGIIMFGSKILAAETDAKPQAITLAQAIGMALESNPEVAAAKSHLEERRANIGAMRSSFYPHLGIAGGTNSERTDESRANEPIAYVYASYNIFNGFKDAREVSISQIEAEKAELQFEQTKNQLRIDVEQSFNTYLFASEAIALRLQALETNRELAETAAKRRRAGAASEADVIEFELRESILRSELVSFEQDREDARLALTKAIGRPDLVFEATGKLEHQHIKGSLVEYVSKLQEKSPFVQGSRKELVIAEERADQWQAGWFPKIDLEARSGKLELSDGPADSKRATEFLLLAKMDIFSGLESTYERRQGAALKILTENKYRSVLSGSEAEIKRHYSRIVAIQTSVDLEEKNVARARRYYQTVLREYNAGVKNSIDLKSAAEMVYETSLKKLRYRHAFIVEKGEMERLLGLAVDVEVIQEDR